MFGIGMWELILIVVVLGLLLVPGIVAAVVILASSRGRDKRDQ